MTFTNQADRQQSCVLAQVTGNFTEQDAGDIIDLAVLPDNRGFNLLLDLRDIERFDFQTSVQMLNIVKKAAQIDVRDRRTKFAVIVGSDEDFGFSRMYQSYRESLFGSNRDIKVFRSEEEARAWIGLT